MTNKVDAASNVIFVYQYDADNRLTNRWTPVNTNTTYAYDSVGNLTSITYFNPHPATNTYAYDAMNRLTNMVDTVGASAYGYDQAGQLLSEDGPWPNDTVSYTYNDRLRTGLSLLQPNADPWNQTYSYDNARRLTGVVSSGLSSFTYTLRRHPPNAGEQTAPAQHGFHHQHVRQRGPPVEHDPEKQRQHGPQHPFLHVRSWAVNGRSKCSTPGTL